MMDMIMRAVGPTRQMMPQVVLSLLVFWIVAVLTAAGAGGTFGCMLTVYQKNRPIRAVI